MPILPALLTVILAVIASPIAAADPAALPGWKFDEQVLILTNEPGVRIHINAPAPNFFTKRKPVRLIFYALPNGNTIEQTIGKKMNDGDDWHFDIQHVGAQTRFLRQILTNEVVVIVYLENSLKSWPAWRKTHGDKFIPEIVESVQKRFSKHKIRTVLTGHSGGGSFTFGYLNCLEKIPGDIDRIAFLDSNYAYDTKPHRDKLLQWIKGSGHYLTVLAYHDDIALLNGKTFVSASGGTWGRSHLMISDFENKLTFSRHSAANIPGLVTVTALKGRVQFLLKENPEKKILHTVQVERNGFIHAMISGTKLESKGYTYLGERAYTQYIRD